MNKLGVSKGVSEGVAVAPGGWEVLLDQPKPRQRVRNRWSTGLGTELSTQSQSGSDPRPRVPTPRTRLYARTPSCQVFVAPTPSPLPLYNGRMGFEALREKSGAQTPPSSHPSSWSARAPLYVMQPKRGGGSDG